jgi:hypothetical protein
MDTLRAEDLMSKSLKDLSVNFKILAAKKCLFELGSFRKS